MYHIWHYYTNDGWKDDGVDTVNTFTNQSAGIIKGSQTAGKVFAENDGTGSVYGWDALNNRVDSIETKDASYDAHISDTTIHVTSTEKSTWNAKADVSDIPKYTSILTNDSNFVADANYEHIDKSDVTANTNARHTHNNKSILDGISS
mgnify:CR=1 FL=1